MDLNLNKIVKKLEDNSFVTNFIKELSEQLEKTNNKNQMNNENIGEMELTPEEEKIFYRKKWDLLEGYFNKELSNLSKGEAFLVTDKFENDDEYHRYKVTQYKNNIEHKKIAFEKDLPNNVQIGDIVRKVDNHYILDEQATEFIKKSINNIIEDIKAER